MIPCIGKCSIAVRLRQLYPQPGSRPPFHPVIGDREKLPAAYHGTGDVFASCALGGIMRGLDFPAALTLAEDFTQECIQQTLSDPERRAYGVSFERVLPMLINRLSEEGRGGNP
jgi:hypothetical protein